MDAGPGTEGEGGGEDVGAAAQSAVGVDLGTGARHRVDDLRQGGQRPVQLPSTVVRAMRPDAPAATSSRASSPRSTPLTTMGRPRARSTQPADDVEGQIGCALGRLGRGRSR